MEDHKNKSVVPHIVIVGGGFGGVYTALGLLPLARRKRIRITLVSKVNHFLFTPLLHEVATGGLSPHSITEPIRQIFRNEPVEFVEADVTSIDIPNKTVLADCKGETCSECREFKYDYLVLSTGARTNFRDTPGAVEYSLQLKDLDDAIAIRGKVVELFEEAMKRGQSEPVKLVVIGGGPTGVELSAELADLAFGTMEEYYGDKVKAKITMVNAGPDLLPMFTPKVRAAALKSLTQDGVEVCMDAMVSKVEAGSVTLASGESLPFDMLMWTAGVTPNTYNGLSEAGIAFEKSTRITIDDTLLAKGRDDVFVLGDQGGTLPMLAQVAVQQAKVVAKNISFSIAKKPLKNFVYKSKGSLVSLGQWMAAGEVFGIVITGALAWWLWRTVYLFKFASWRKRIRIVSEWTLNLFNPRDITRS